jgi:hypothetical protein
VAVSVCANRCQLVTAVGHIVERESAGLAHPSPATHAGTVSRWRHVRAEIVNGRARGRGPYRRSLRGMVIHVRWHFRHRISISLFVASTSWNRFDPHCGQGSARDRSRSGGSCLTRARRVAGCRRAALRVSREPFIGAGSRAKLMPLRPTAYTRGQSQFWLLDVLQRHFTQRALFTRSARARRHQRRACANAQGQGLTGRTEGDPAAGGRRLLLHEGRRLGVFDIIAIGSADVRAIQVKAGTSSRAARELSGANSQTARRR